MQKSALFAALLARPVLTLFLLTGLVLFAWLPFGPDPVSDSFLLMEESIRNASAPAEVAIELSDAQLQER
jgi:hypothetical protein